MMPTWRRSAIPSYQEKGPTSRLGSEAEVHVRGPRTGRRERKGRRESVLVLGSPAAPPAGSRTVPPLPPLVLADGVQEFHAVQRRPVHVAEVELRVRHLPEQEIGDALLPRG